MLSPLTLARRRNPRLRDRRPLPFRQRRRVEVRDQTLKQPAPVQLRAQPHEHAPEPDRRSIHQDEFTRWLYSARPFQSGMDFFGDRSPELRIIGFLNAANPVLGKWLVQKASPKIEHVHLFGRQVLETPGLVSVMRLRVVVVAYRLVQVDDTAHEAR